MAILFSPLRTRRICVRLRELTISDIVQLLSTPPDLHEAAVSEWLRFAAAAAERPTPHHITDPRMMTVQERMLLSAHYVAHVSETGADFKIGEAKLSSYLLPGRDWDGKPVDLGTIRGKRCQMWPLLGWMAEVLETTCTGRGQWQLGAMGCQLVFGDEKVPAGDTVGTAAAIEWVKARRDKMAALPESEFLAVLDAWEQGDEKLTHLFAIGYQDEGIVALPTPEAAKEAGAAGLAPARFPREAAVSEFTRRLFQPRR